ncbi:MAG: DMT family transporter [Prevotella sp.]|jgi:drug/metabolite transporter (DMT)-like permease
MKQIKSSSPRLRGCINASLSAGFFGLIPLFSIPVLKSGMALPSVLVYRFAFGSLFMLLFLVFRKVSLRLRWGDALRLSLLAVLYSLSGVALFSSYSYMPSGVATTLLFSYPVFTTLLEALLFHQRMTWPTYLALVLAVAGVYFLSGFGAEGESQLKGVLLAVFSGLDYAVYMVIFPRLRIHTMNSVKINFYVFFISMLFLLLYSSFVYGGVAPMGDWHNMVNLMLLGLFPTMISNVTLVRALNLIDATTVSVLGAFEPLTAMCVGILVMGEPFTWAVAIGFVAILAAVTILTTQSVETGHVDSDTSRKLEE